MYIGTSFSDPSKKISVAVLIDGREQPLYRRVGDGRVFVAGTEGVAYTLRIRNLTSGSLEVVTAIDHRDIMTDRSIDLATARGRVVRAGGATEILGWRLNNEQVGQFVFADPAASIAAQAAESVATTGVIGFAVYEEQNYGYSMPHPMRMGGGLESTTYDTPRGPSTRGQMFGGSAPEPAQRSLGTGIGGTIQSAVQGVHFMRKPGEPVITGLGYHSFETLEGMGLIRPGEPDFFPAPQPAGTTGYGNYISRVGD